MITVEEALQRCFALVTPMPAETVALRQAAGRVLARPVIAERAQPPFRSSAMDGYAVRVSDVSTGARLRVIGESAAGARFGQRHRDGVVIGTTGATAQDNMGVLVARGAHNGDPALSADP